MRRRTRIVATLGPAVFTREAVAALVEAGMDVARLVLAQGSLDEHLRSVEDVRQTAAAAGRHIGVLAELPGQRIRLAGFADDAFLHGGAQVELVPADPEGTSTAERLGVAHPGLLADLQPGDDIGLADGAVILVVDEVGGQAARATVRTGGRLRGRPSVHLPGARVGAQGPAEDGDLIAALVQAGVDMLAVPFVRHADDVHRVRAASKAAGGTPLVVAKIETAEAVSHLEDIVDAADAVIVARGDLALELGASAVPHVQKRVTHHGVTQGRPVVIATQMLDSLTHSPQPTRAEVSDVTNAIYDGADALMLSAETAIGDDPANAVRTLVRIALETEAQGAGTVAPSGELRFSEAVDPVTAAMTHAAWQAAYDTGATAILCCSRSSATVRAMARFRPAAALVCASDDESTLRQVSLTWGAIPVAVPATWSVSEVVDQALAEALDVGIIHAGDIVAILAGSYFDGDPTTSALRLHRLP